jgi:choline dehydrogenase-like flavoprotein
MTRVPHTEPNLDETYDAIVVGSGAGGGMAAYVLTARGARVLLLEAGRAYDPGAETAMFSAPAAAPLFGEPTPDKPLGYYTASIGGWVLPGEPYTIAPGSDFRWFRSRMLGGRTNHWGRLSLRFGPYDFMGRSRDGMGVDWPIAYDDLAPWYDRVERLIGVFGAAEGLENSPDSPPDGLHPPPPPRAYEYWATKAFAKVSPIRFVPAHMAILTRPHNDRPACFYASDCMRGCAIGANFQSPNVLLAPAQRTGRLTLRTGAQVYEVVVDGAGRANGVRFIDVGTGARHKARSRSVVLGASTVETARILLNSRSTAFPEGLANTHGQVGRNLTDTVKIGVFADVPALQDLPPFNDEGASLFHVYAPWWNYGAQRAGALNFAKGYHLEIWGGRREPDVTTMAGVAAGSGVWGEKLHAAMTRGYGGEVYLSASGEMIPNADTYVDLDPEIRDRFGLPVPRFHWRFGEHDLATASQMRRTLGEAFQAAGARVKTALDTPIEDAIRVGGSVNHEVGTCRMGRDPRDSVVDSWSRAWNVANLYVVDGAVFASNPDKNPTLTILALAWRASEHLADALSLGDI